MSSDVGLPLRDLPISWSLLWLPTESDSTRSYYQFELQPLTRNSARPVAAKGNSDPPAEVDGEERAIALPAEHRLGHRTDPERLQDKGGLARTNHCHPARSSQVINHTAQAGDGTLNKFTVVFRRVDSYYHESGPAVIGLGCCGVPATPIFFINSSSIFHKCWYCS